MRTTRITTPFLFLCIVIPVFLLAPFFVVRAEFSVSSLLEQIKALQQKVFLLQSQIKKTEEAPIQNISTTTVSKPFFHFDSILSVGSAGDDVTNLQEALTKNGVYEGPVTGYFGSLTKAGVKAFQEKYEDEILTPLGLSRGTGYFGISTRKKLNVLNFVVTQTKTSPAETSEGSLGGQVKQYPLVTTSATPPDTTTSSFDGVDDFVDAGNSLTLTLSNNFEISFLVKTTDIQNTLIVGKIDEGGSYNQYWYVGIVGGGSGRIETSLGDGTNFSQIFSTVSIADGRWHKIVWKREGDNQTIFIDGNDETDINYIDSDIGDVNPPTSIIIGGDIESDDYYFNGTLDDITISVGGVVVGEWNF